MQLTVLEILMQFVLSGSPTRLNADALIIEGEAVLALSVVSRCRWRHAAQSRGMRLMALATRRAAAQMATTLERGARALLRLHDVDDVNGFVPSLRTAVRNLVIERNIVANLLNRHPRLRREVYDLRLAAEDTCPELETSDEEGLEQEEP